MAIETLTIEAEGSLIHAAADVAARNHMKLSDLVIRYLEALTTHVPLQPSSTLPPLTLAASGLLKNLPDRPYRELIEEAICEKHGIP
jgi:hypothetical protein